MKLRKEDIDWTRVRWLAANSFQGHGQSDDDTSFMQAVFKADKKQYSEVTRAVKDEIRKDLMRGRL